MIETCFSLILLTIANQTCRQDDITIDVGIESSNYTYKITNQGDDPITAVEFRPHAAHLFGAPADWNKEQEPGVFRARAPKPDDYLSQGQTGTFTLRVSSRGAILGSMPVTVQTASGRTIALKGVWGPVPESRIYIGAVAATLALLIIWHGYKSRGRKLLSA